MSKTFSTAFYLASTALCGALCLAAAPAAAQQRDFSIAGGDLKAALGQFEATSGQHVRTDGMDLSGVTTKGAQGALSSKQALERLLDGTALMACSDGHGLAIAAKAAGCGKDNTTLSDIVVTSGVSHLADRNRTGTRMDADPMTVPLSISTVSEELILRQQAVELADAAANVSGVNSGIQGSFSMRGFGANIMRNGTLGADGASNNLPLIAISRLEVVKGPEAIIAGIGAGYGGVVNVITKTPPARPVATVTASVGSRGYYDTGFDVGGPLTQNNMFGARLTGSTQRSDHTQAGYKGGRSDYLAPSATFKAPKLGTDLTVQYEYQKTRSAPDTNVFAMPGATRLEDDLPIVTYGPTDAHRDTKSNVWTVSLEQKVVEGWSLAVRYTNDKKHSVSNVGSSLALFALIPPPSIPTIIYDMSQDANVEALKLELRGNFDTGPIAHKLLLAYDDQKNTIRINSAGKAVYVTNTQTGVSTDATATLGPIFGAPSPAFLGGANPAETGVLLMDQMTWGDLIVLAGVRRMKYEYAGLNTPKDTPFEKTLPSLGVVYRVSPTLSLYGNASKGFKPNQGQYTFAGAPVEPENAQQYEVGAKALVMQERVAVTAALFKIDQKNVANPDPDHRWPSAICLGSNQVCYVSIPGVQAKGFELEVSGRVLPRLDVRGTYSYTDQKVAPGFLNTVPYSHHKATLWANYSFGDDGLGWWLGGGAQIRSARNETGRVGDVRNPGNIRLDASLGYEALSWSATFGVKNLANERLYDIASGINGYGTVVQPRQFMATLRYKFR